MSNFADEAELKHRVAREADALAIEFAGIFGKETIDRYISESMEAFKDRTHVVEFVPLLAWRFARERLKAFATAEGLIEKQQPEVLFVCVHNAGRSQMAAALLVSRSE